MRGEVSLDGSNWRVVRKWSEKGKGENLIHAIAWINVESGESRCLCRICFFAKWQN